MTDALFVDLPGHGETGCTHLDDYSAPAQAELIVEVFGSMGVTPGPLLGFGLGGGIAAELAARYRGSTAPCLLFEPWEFDVGHREDLAKKYAPPFKPRDYGQHLLEAWYQVRDGELFWPWYSASYASRAAWNPDLDPDSLHERTVDLLKAGGAFRASVQALMDYDLQAGINNAARPVITLARSGNGPRATAAQCVAEFCRGQFVVLPENRDDWSPALNNMSKTETV